MAGPMIEIDLDDIKPWFERLGYRANPLEVRSLEPNDEGLRLLVGRNEEMQALCTLLLSTDKVICVEGAWGVGKTSLVNAASYFLSTKYLDQKLKQKIIPCSKTFELTAELTLDDFVRSVYVHVMQALLKAAKTHGSLDTLGDKAEAIKKYLNDPAIMTGGGVNVLGIGGSASTAINTSAGFWATGIEKVAQDWLEEIFPQRNSGGVVCVIDNLEGLQSSATARRLLNSLRDRLFNVQGLKWVICGANGIVNCAASSRVADYFTTPLEIQDLLESRLPTVLDSRLEEYAIPGHSQQLPITHKAIEFLYSTLNSNLRGCLSMAAEYCKETVEQAPILADDDAKTARFERWIKQRAATTHTNVERVLPKPAWAILDVVMSDEFKGQFGIGNLAQIRKLMRSSASDVTLRKHINALTKEDLVVRQFDAEDGTGESTDTSQGRGAYFRVTHRGALCHFHRLVNGKRETYAFAHWLRTSAGLRG